jgi:molybdopterin converting factor small subunit
MAAATSSGSITLEFHGALADRFAALGERHGSRTRVRVPLRATVADLLTALPESDDRYAYLFDRRTGALPEHVEVVLNDRVLDLQGGITAPLRAGDTLTFLPAHAGGSPP